MIRALWFMVKVGLVVTLALWVAENPGFVEMSWLDYTLRVHVGVFLILVTAIILISIFVYNVIRAFVDFPKSYRRYREIKNRENGFRALTIGLTAVAAGDTKSAVHQAERARKYLEGDTGLSLLLQAQAARLDGREEDAQKSFVALLENEDASFLGVRGLLQTALDTHNQAEALDLARRALLLHPKQPWILKTVYDLEICARAWAEALKILDRAEKAGALSKDQADSDRVAMMLAQAGNLLGRDARGEALKKAQKAYRLAPDFEPAAALLARLYNQAGKRRQAIFVIEKAWKSAPHPELAAVWDAIGLTARGKKKPGRLAWFEKLAALNPDHVQSQLQAGKIALEEGLWGEARSHFIRAEQIAPSAGLYRLLATLEERGSHNEDAALMWLEKAADAPADKVWICRKTGHVYERWQPIAQPHGAFNTIEWRDSQEMIEDGGTLAQHGEVKNAGLLEVSKAS